MTATTVTVIHEVYHKSNNTIHAKDSSCKLATNRSEHRHDTGRLILATAAMMRVRQRQRHRQAQQSSLWLQRKRLPVSSSSLLLNSCLVLWYGMLILTSIIVISTVSTTHSFTCVTVTDSRRNPQQQQQQQQRICQQRQLLLQSPIIRGRRTTLLTTNSYHCLFAKASSTGSRKNNSSKSKDSTGSDTTKKGFGSIGSGPSLSVKSDSSKVISPAATATGALTTATGKAVPQKQPSSVVPTAAVVSKKEQSVLLQRLQKQYGGITPTEIARGTQQKMTEYVQQLPTHIQMAIRLYTKLQQYNATASKLSIYQQTQLLSNVANRQQLELMQMDQQQLNDIYTTHNIGNMDIHNILQQMTWDTSAHAKFVKSRLGTMNPDIVQRITKACSYIVDAVVAADAATATATANNNHNDRPGHLIKGKCLDVGCGYGALIPILTTTKATSTGGNNGGDLDDNATIQPFQIHGIDISTEMIKYGQELYPSCHFMAGDFLQYNPTVSSTNSDGTDEHSVDEDTNHDDGYFDGIIFCSSLHDMPNIYLVLEKAISLLRHSSTTNSTIVIVHAQGARHVQLQHTKNPILVPQLLPTAVELQSFLDTHNNNKNDVGDDKSDTAATSTKLQLTVAPADANTPTDTSDGYLAVIQRLGICKIN